MIKNKFSVLLNKRSYSCDFSWLPKLTKIVHDKFKIKKEISLAIISDSEIQNLNKVYRHKNKVTDVLSFILDSEDTLGEIVICLSQAKRQAKEKKHSLRSELQLLTVHGILHLLGYDHELNAKEEQRQHQAEQEILSLLNK